MLNKIYIAAGAVLLSGYFAWSLLGWEFGGKLRDSVPSVRRASSTSSSGYSRSRPSGGFFGGGGFGK